MAKRMRVHPRHWALLLDFLELHPKLITGKFSSINSKQKSNDLWAEITDKLNALGLGTKTSEKWKAALTDWKCKVKSKCQLINKSRAQTGGGPENETKLNENECRLMALVGWSGVEGVDSGLEECGLEANISSNIGRQLEQNDEEVIVESTLVEEAPKRSPKPMMKKKTSATENKTDTKKKRDKAENAEKDLETCHEETLQVLNDINANIKQLTNNVADVAIAINNSTVVLEKMEVTMSRFLGTSTTSVVEQDL